VVQYEYDPVSRFNFTHLMFVPFVTNSRKAGHKTSLVKLDITKYFVKPDLTKILCSRTFQNLVNITKVS
jgi:hypothetical protein